MKIIIIILFLGIANTYKEAKRIAARLMYDQVCEIGVEKLNELKILEPKILFHKVL